MKVDEPSIPRAPCTKPMYVDHLRCSDAVHYRNGSLKHILVGGVHQPPNRFACQMKSGPENVQRNCDGEDRVE